MHGHVREPAAARSLERTATPAHSRECNLTADLLALQRSAGNASVNALLAVVQRQTAQQLVDDCTSWGVLHREDLANRLLPLLRSGDYALVSETLRLANRSAVVEHMMGQLTPLELVRLARVPAAVPALRTMSAQLADAWFIDVDKLLLLRAVLDEPGARDGWNRKRIQTFRAGVSDLEALALMFDDDQIVDDDSLPSRLHTILSVTEHLVIPGLQTGIDFSDTGFRGDQQRGGAGFRDPDPSSRNQVGHFLTAVGLRYAPDVVARPIPYLGSIRAMVGAPASMTNDDVALRLTIGHEKAPDPSGAIEAFMSIVAAGFIESLLPGPDGETDEQRDRRIGRAVEEQTRHQINEIIAAFRRQFQATTDHDIEAWNRALGQLGQGGGFDVSAIEGPGSPLNEIAVGSGRGNSIQDLRLSLVGWRFGQMIQQNAFSDRHAAANWLRTNLGAAAAAPAPVR